MPELKEELTITKKSTAANITELYRRKCNLSPISWKQESETGCLTLQFSGEDPLEELLIFRRSLLGTLSRKEVLTGSKIIGNGGAISIKPLRLQIDRALLKKLEATVIEGVNQVLQGYNTEKMIDGPGVTCEVNGGETTLRCDSGNSSPGDHIEEILDGVGYKSDEITEEHVTIVNSKHTKVTIPFGMLPEITAALKQNKSNLVKPGFASRFSIFAENNSSDSKNFDFLKFQS